MPLKRTSGAISYLPGTPAFGDPPAPATVLGYGRLVFLGKYTSQEVGQEALLHGGQRVELKFDVVKWFDSGASGQETLQLSMFANEFDAPTGTDVLVIADVAVSQRGSIPMLSWAFEGGDTEPYLRLFEAVLNGEVERRLRVLVENHGRPIPGATVTIALRARGAGRRFQRTATSDEDGRVEFSHLPEGLFSMSAKKPGYRMPSNRWGDYDACLDGLRGTQERAIKMAARNRVAGRLRGPQGSGASLVSVELEMVGQIDEAMRVPVFLGSVTGKGGRFAIEDIPPGRYRLVTTSTGSRIANPEPRLYCPAPERASSPLVLELEADTTIEGIVWQLPDWGSKTQCELSAVNSRGEHLRIVEIRDLRQDRADQGGAPVVSGYGRSTDPVQFSVYENLSYHFEVKATRDFAAEIIDQRVAELRAQDPDASLFSIGPMDDAAPPIQYERKIVELPPGVKPTALELVFQS